MIKTFSRITVFNDQGRNIELRCLKASDALFVHEAIEESLLELKTFLAWPHIPMNVRQRELFLDKCYEQGQAGHGFYMGLFCQTKNRFISGAGLHPRCPLNPLSLEIGYYTRTSEVAKGWATLLTQILTAASLLWLGADTVRVSCAENNPWSKRVIERCGFKFEALLRNWTASPTQEMRDGGYVASPNSCMYSLITQDIPDISEWLAPLVKQMKVYSHSGSQIFPQLDGDHISFDQGLKINQNSCEHPFRRDTMC